MKMPTIVGIFISISRENFMLSWAEQKKFYKLGDCLPLWPAELSMEKVLKQQGLSSIMI